MKKFTRLSILAILFCLFTGVKTSQAQTCTVNFSYTVGSNGVVNFTGIGSPSTFTTNYYWYFPGSNVSSVQGSGSGFLNPTATYSANGIYTVMFGMYSAAPLCSVNITQTISVGNNTTNPTTCPLNVQFSTPSPNQCNGSATVTPPGSMCGPITYTWVPGNVNGSVISGLCQGTTYTVYASSGSTGTNCCASAIGVVNIPTVNPCALNANFNWTQSSGGVINFNNTSTGTNGGSTYSWNFGDGGNSTSTSPVHTYTANGSYTVTQTVNNNLSPACIDVQVYTVYVNSICNLSAGFTYNNQTSNILNFTNTTSGNFGPVGYSWNFGDGSPNSTATNPAHTYNAVGTYTVILTANNFSISSGTCIDTAMAVVNITTICIANASFSLSPTSTPQFWNAFPLVPSNVIAASWYWGDGNSSNTLYTSHAYASAGTYSICLSVTLSCGATTTYCAPYAIYRSSQDMSVVYINVVDPSAPNAIKNTAVDNLKFSVFPNPSNGSFNLKGLKNGAVSISVFNLVGKMVYQSENVSSAGNLLKDIELDGIANGVYFIKVNADNKFHTAKIVIDHNN